MLDPRLSSCRTTSVSSAEKGSTEASKGGTPSELRASRTSAVRDVRALIGLMPVYAILWDNCRTWGDTGEGQKGEGRRGGEQLQRRVYCLQHGHDCA
jgi:hypothetical protein